MTHDYKRNGTTTLFAALDVLKGEVIGRGMPQHRHQEFLKFLRAIDRSTPKHLDIHGIADNYATHKKQGVKDWLTKHPRFPLHFIPTSSWLNLVERWFGKITTERIRRGVFTSVPELERARPTQPRHHPLSARETQKSKQASLTELHWCRRSGSCSLAAVDSKYAPLMPRAPEPEISGGILFMHQAGGRRDHDRKPWFHIPCDSALYFTAAYANITMLGQCM